MSSATIALLTILIISFLWSTAGVTTKILLRAFDPYSLAFLRFLVATLVILPFFLKQKQPKLFLFVIDVLPIALLSTVNILFYYLGLKLTTVNASAIIYTILPLGVALLAKYFLGEHLTKRKVWGIILGFIGILVIVLLPLLNANQAVTGDFRGNLLILIAAFSWILYTVGSRHLISTKHYSPFSITAASLFTSMVVFGLATIFFSHQNLLLPLANPLNLILVLHLAILVTVATYLLFQWAIKYSSATTASLTNYLQPVFAILLAIVILGEKLTWGFIGGSVLVFLGVFLATGTQVLRQVKALINKVF